MSGEKEYVLGTHDEEVARLGLQHRVWRPRALDAWRRAGFTHGATILDLGCGPGYAALDLAEIVGPSGRVIAVDRSRRFLDVLEAARRARGLDNITTHEVDLDEVAGPGGAWPSARAADGAWARWVFAFVRRPRALLERVRDALKPGGTLVHHEYFDYRTWRLAPRSVEMEEFVQVVIDSWRASGGEPDIGLDLPGWLEEIGFEIRDLRTIVDVVPATDFIWQWPRSFVESGLARFVALGRLTPARARAMWDAFLAAEASPRTRMVTPAVLEIVAVRRG